MLHIEYRSLLCSLREEKAILNVSLKVEIHPWKNVQITLEKLSLTYQSKVSNLPEAWRDGEKIMNMELGSLF